MSRASLFYGSLSIETVLFESAYYRFVFWQGMTVPPNDKFELITSCSVPITPVITVSNYISLLLMLGKPELTDRCSYTVTPSARKYYEEWQE